jgi:hypothetical protein
VVVPELQEVVMIAHSGIVQLVNPGKFNELLCSAMREHLVLELIEHEALTPSRKTIRRGKNACLQRFQQLCRPFDTRLLLDSVGPEEGIIVEPSEKT